MFGEIFASFATIVFVCFGQCMRRFKVLGLGLALWLSFSFLCGSHPSAPLKHRDGVHRGQYTVGSTPGTLSPGCSFCSYSIKTSKVNSQSRGPRRLCLSFFFFWQSCLFWTRTEESEEEAMDFLGNLRGLWMLVLLLFCMPSDGFQFPPVKPSEDNLKGICDSKTMISPPQSDQGSKLFNQEITLIFLESQYRRCCMKYEDQEDTLECLLEKWDTAFIIPRDRSLKNSPLLNS
ncbi:hypothetical protein COCON_G00129940 [Conger conger]|uniref:Uncharacterized protein n=1 Tax=Conger conger TaxID=82655 RepID=A0A9Q1HX61_CONCO|nr:hypothetical protein COCON_G00129940 [Conger conger]